MEPARKTLRRFFPSDLHFVRPTRDQKGTTKEGLDLFSLLTFLEEYESFYFTPPILRPPLPLRLALFRQSRGQGRPGASARADPSTR